MSGDMNGTAHAIPPGLGQIGNPEIIAIVEKLLAAVRAGNVAGLGLLEIGPGGTMNITTCGNAPPPLIHCGAAIMQKQMIDQMTGGGKPSRILTLGR